MSEVTTDSQFGAIGEGVEVRQGQFGFGDRGTASALLVTADVWTCMGLIAIHRESGLVFLAHLDVPWYGGSVDAALTELRSRVQNPSDVELYDVAGVTPNLIIFLSLCCAAIAMVAHDWVFWLGGGLSLAALGLGTRLRTRFMLRKLGFGCPKLLTPCDVSAKRRALWDLRINARIHADIQGGPALSFPRNKGRDPRFDTLSSTECLRETWKRGAWEVVKRVLGFTPLSRAKGSA